MEIMTRLLLPLLATLLLCSCSPEKRLARLLRQHPELVKKDTIWRRDTTISKEVSKDSSFYYYQTDTVFMREGKLTVKYVMNHDSTVYISGKCDADTIIKLVPQIINNVVAGDVSRFGRIKNWCYDNLLFPILILLIAFLVWEKVRK
jgi:hypothetical protein